MSSLQIIRTKDLAELLSVSTFTIWDWEKKGILPPKVKLGPRASGWRKSDIEDWMEERTENEPEAVAV